MSLKEALSEVSTEEYGCKVKILKTKLNKEDLIVFESVLKDPVVTTASISRALKKEGFSISVHSLGRHRRGDCNCGVK